MRGRILVLIALISLSAAASAHAQDEHRWACAFSVSAGRPVGLPGNDTMTPWLGVSFEYALTPRLALEATVTTMKAPYAIGLDQFEAGAIVYARPITRFNTWLPYVRVAGGVTSDDFTELPSYPMARVGAGAEFNLRPSSAGIPGISRPNSTWGMRVEGSAELFNKAGYDPSRRNGLIAFARISVALVHRF